MTAGFFEKKRQTQQSTNSNGTSIASRLAYNDPPSFSMKNHMTQQTPAQFSMPTVESANDPRVEEREETFEDHDETSEEENYAPQ